MTGPALWLAGYLVFALWVLWCERPRSPSRKAPPHD